MTKINQLAALGDKHQLEEIELNILSLDRQEDGQYGKNYSCTASDETGKTFVKFGAIKNHDVANWVGKKVLFKAARNQTGQLCSIRTDKKGNYTNLYITNSVKATVSGAATAPAPGYSPPNAVSTPPPPDIPPNLLAKRIAEEWVAVHNWTKDVFLPAVGEDGLRECVTGVVIRMQRLGVPILPPIEPPKKPWRDVLFKDLPLGSWEPERIRKALVKLYQGAKVGPEITTALLDAAEEPEFSPMNCFMQMTIDSGVEDDDINAVLMRDFSTLDSMQPDQIKQIIINGKAFIEECQKVAAAKPSIADEIDV